MHYFLDYLLFLFKSLSLLAVVLLGVAGILALASKNKPKSKLKVIPLHEKYNDLYLKLAKAVLDKKAFKRAVKKAEKSNKDLSSRPHCFVIPFTGDIRASTVNQLREAVTMVLTLATAKDKVVILLDSPGGVVNGYGLCAAQLARLRDRSIPLTIIVDKVAASGGYLMAAVGNKILAAPFALIGSIGVLAQLPNFHRLLKRYHVDFEQLSAGEYKRTLTLFGENTHKGRNKMQEELEEIHTHFKDYIQHYRPQLDLAKVATGEYWLATQALDLQLIDGISTSDDYLMALKDSHALFEICHEIPKTLIEKIVHGAHVLIRDGLLLLRKKDTEPPLSML
ncbi:MAG: sohB [Gammaproteobacteria bacterium]|jgi:serine protease SohB|nr:sohB [Gammaproteobacteria bacterium]